MIRQAQTQQNKSKSKHPRKRSSFFKLFYLGILMLFLIIILRQEWKIYQVHEGIKSSEAHLTQLKKERADLEQEVKNLQDLKYIEKVARSEYKMIKPNEIPIVIK